MGLLVDFPAKGVCRVHLQTFVFVSVVGRYSYLRVGETDRSYYYLTLHNGIIDMEHHGKQSDFVTRGLKAHSKCDLRHAARIYMDSTLAKTDKAIEILDAILLSNQDRINFLPDQPKEREKRERLTKIEKSKLKANTISLEQLCEKLDVEPSRVRAAFRRHNFEKPGARWQWPKSQLTELLAKVKNLLKS